LLFAAHFPFLPAAFSYAAVHVTNYFSFRWKIAALVVRFVAEFMRLISNICVFVCQNGPPCETVTCEVILITIVLENKEFLYTDAEEPIPCLDQTRLYYFMTDEAEFYHCKTTTTELYVCTQRVAMSRHSQET
jgi:hypothetical protein